MLRYLQIQQQLTIFTFAIVYVGWKVGGKKPDFVVPFFFFFTFSFFGGREGLISFFQLKGIKSIFFFVYTTAIFFKETSTAGRQSNLVEQTRTFAPNFQRHPTLACLFFLCFFRSFFYFVVIDCLVVVRRQRMHLCAAMPHVCTQCGC